MSRILLLVMLVGLISCKSEYETMVNQEIKKDLVLDSLIFGMKMGMTKKDFYSVCWDLNKQQVISQGTGNKYARYIEPLDDSKVDTLRKELQFFGLFDDQDVMRGMDMIYSYVSWAPWNKGLHADQLAVRLKDDLMNEYEGNEFIEIDIKDKIVKAYVKIDGNRQITLYPKNNKDVAMKIEDLRYKLNK